MTLEDWIETFHWYSHSVFDFVSWRQSAFPVLVVLNRQKLHFVVICMSPMHSNWFRLNSPNRVVLFQIAPHIFVYTYLSLPLSVLFPGRTYISFTRWYLCTTYMGSKYRCAEWTFSQWLHSNEMNNEASRRCLHISSVTTASPKQYEYIYFN